MISMFYIGVIENLPADEIIKALRKFSKYDIEETRNELLDFRDSKNQLRYPHVFQALDDIMNKQLPKKVNVK